MDLNTVTPNYLQILVARGLRMTEYEQSLTYKYDQIMLFTLNNSMPTT